MFFDVIESYGGRQVADFFSVWSLIALVLYFITSSDSGSHCLTVYLRHFRSACHSEDNSRHSPL